MIKKMLILKKFKTRIESKLYNTFFTDALNEKWLLYQHNHSDNPYRWSLGSPCPNKCVEAFGVVIRDKLYLFGGYASIDKVHQTGCVFDLKSEKWIHKIDMPPGFAQTHVGCASDGDENIFMAGGQIGPNCSPCTDQVHVFNIRDESFSELPPLPEKRYLGVAVYYQNRLHVMGGSQENRHTGSKKHWSLKIKNSQAVEEYWQVEPPIPRGGVHRGSVLKDDCLYVVGGSEGDLKPIAGDTEFRCDRNTPPENVHGEFWKYQFSSKKWTRLPDMPVPLFHTDTSTVTNGRKIYTFGGIPSRKECLNKVFAYDLTENTWEQAGTLPYSMKTNFTVLHGGKVYLITGQRSRSMENLLPGKVLDSVWSAKLE